MDMTALTQMLANGWPLALAGFFLGVLAGGAIPQANKKEDGVRLAPGEDGLSALTAELKAARELLEAEESDAVDTAETLKNLDEAIKRANGRLKLIMKAVKRAK